MGVVRVLGWCFSVGIWFFVAQTLVCELLSWRGKIQKNTD